MEQMINANPQFTVETKSITLSGRPATLTSRTPILAPEQREKRRREIEAILYDVCRKYRSA
jgi:hypothetical protein